MTIAPPDKDYEVKVTVRNNYLIVAMDNAGFASAAAIERHCGIRSSFVLDLMNLRIGLFAVNGNIKLDARTLADVLGVDVLELVPPQHLVKGLAKNTAFLKMDLNEVAELTSDHTRQRLLSPILKAEQDDITGRMVDLLDALPPRYGDMIILRYGIGCPPHTLKEVGDIYGITGSRVREIVSKGERLMRGKIVRQEVDNETALGLDAPASEKIARPDGGYYRAWRPWDNARTTDILKPFSEGS